MKKTLSMILVVIMVFSTFSCLTLTASAANDVVAISFEPTQPLEVIENVDGWEYECWRSDCEQCDGVFFDYFYYPLFGNEGDVLTVTYSDGKSVDYTYNGNGYFIGTDGNEIAFGDLITSDEQYDEHWSVPGEYSFTLTYADCSTTVPVTVIENPVKSIYFTPAEAIELMELVDGYWTETESEEAIDEDYFEYEYECKDGDILTVNYTDNTSVNYVFDDVYDFVGSNGDVISPFDVLFYSNQSYDNQWIAGGHINL